MLMIDAEGRIALVNREIERIFGYERDALLGRPAELLLPELLRGVCGALCASAGQRQADPSFGVRRELVGLRRDGSELPLEVGLSPIETDDGPCILTSLVDISARRAHERERAELELQLRQAQRLESLGRLAGGIAHDFNNILAAILSLTEVARLTAEGRPAPELDDIVLATNRGRDLVQRILLFSKGRCVASDPTDLSMSVSEAVHAIRATLPHGVEVDVRIDSPGLVVLADATAIHQIVANLVGNAANAMPRGGRIEVRVDRYAERASLLRVQPKLADGAYARIRVVDAGIGMDAATREHAFEPFFTTRRPSEGTGLGLAIVHGLTHDLGGAVWLESQLGKGTTVTCLVPTTLGVARGRAAHGAPSAIRAPSGKRVLFVDDEPILAAATGLLLKKAGYETVVHTDALAALSAFAASRGEWDIIVTDYAMPKVSGLDLAAQLHRLRADVPIVLLTGQMDSFPVPELEASGVDGAVDAAMAILTLHHWDAGQERGVRELRRVARGPVVIVTFDPRVSNAMWLMADYLPEVAELDARIFPLPETIAGWLERGADRVRIEPLPLARDTPDWMLGSYWAHPERVLDEAARAATSGFARMPKDVVDRVVTDVQRDLADGAWEQKHGYLLALEAFDVGLRLIVAGP
jgi:PAS domain S-box-containing protein